MLLPGKMSSLRSLENMVPISEHKQEHSHTHTANDTLFDNVTDVTNVSETGY